SDIHAKQEELFTILELLEELRVSIRQRDHPARDEQIFYVRSRFENIAICDDEIRNLPDIDRTVAVSDTEYLRRVERHRFERFILCKAKRACQAGVIRQIAGLGAIVTA